MAVSGHSPGRDWDVPAFTKSRSSAIELLRLKARGDVRLLRQLAVIDDAIQLGVRMLSFREQRQLIEALEEHRASGSH